MPTPPSNVLIGMVKNDDDEAGRLLRCAVRAVSGYTGESIATIETVLGQEIGVTQAAFPAFYKGRGRKDPVVIRTFLEFGAQRGFLSRTWGRALLEANHYARFGDPVELLDAFWPPEGISVRPPRIYSNLPGNSYPSFVMRHHLYREVLEALGTGSAAVVLVGLPGSGKTTLALEIATQCVRQPVPAGGAGEHRHFDAGVWVSDKDTQGKVGLRTVLETIATTLDFPELSRFDLERLRREVEQLLRGRAVLLIIDNLETISDTRLLQWLRQLPGPSKALITTRVYPPEFENSGPIKLAVGRMTEVESQAFITVYSAAKRLPVSLERETQQQLIEATGGNPLAIQMLLGLLRASGQPLTRVLELSRVSPSRDISALIGTRWQLLREPERQIVLALTLFTPSAADDALREVAGLDELAYIEAIEDLDYAALIETSVQSGLDGTLMQRRTLHPLVRQHAEARLAEDGLFAAAARSRRVAWAVAYAGRFGGFRPNEAAVLAQLGVEEPNLWATLTWTAASGYDRETVTLAHKLEYFYYTRAQWRRNRELYGHLIAAARRLGDPAEIVNALALQIQLLSRQGQSEAAGEELADLVALSRGNTLGGETFFRAQHAQALAHYAGGALREAATAWQTIIAQAEERGVSPKLITGTLHWLALCRQRQGEPTEARALMAQSLAEALEQKNLRRAARNQIALASFALDAGQAEEAQRWLDEARANDPAPDQEQRAHFLLALGRLHAIRGETEAARATFAEALPLFERMGMEPEVREVRGESFG